MRQQFFLSLFSLLLPFALLAQTPPKKPESQQPMGGASTGAPVTYTSRRTAGITDPSRLLFLKT
jgi:hypothetical protein